MRLHEQILPRHTVMASAADSRDLLSESMPNRFSVWVAFSEIVRRLFIIVILSLLIILFNNYGGSEPS